MRYERRSIWSRLFSVFTIGLLLGSMMLLASAVAAEETIKLGVLYSLTGPFAPAGAVAGFRGTKIAIDMVNEKGGVLGKYKVEYVSADARSNPDVAIREAERLIAVEKVPVILGVYSSAIAVPLAEIVEKQKRILWINIAISDAVFKGRNLRYVFRPQPFGSQWGETSVNFLRDEGEAKLGKPLKDITVAILHEDGPYGVSVAKANARRAKELGIKVVMQEAYSHTATDLSSLVLKVRAAQPDIILHTGYFPDIVLFHRQAREMGLKTKAVIGHGAGYANFPKRREALGKGANYLYN
ncbi:MAG: ABC transporter ATP-binding protein, partial [Nitrospinota bacterium]